MEKRYGPRRPCDQNPAFRSDAITSEYNGKLLPFFNNNDLAYKFKIDALRFEVVESWVFLVIGSSQDTRL